MIKNVFSHDCSVINLFMLPEKEDEDGAKWNNAFAKRMTNTSQVWKAKLKIEIIAI